VTRTGRPDAVDAVDADEVGVFGVLWPVTCGFAFLFMAA